MDSDLTAALELLDQAARLAEQVDNDCWTTPSISFRNSTIGQHFRHVLDHYDSLLNGVELGLIDYDARNRDKSIEASPAIAAFRCGELRKGLVDQAKTKPSTHPVSVKTSCSVSEQVKSQSSSFGRESQFIVSHTIHHFAIIAAICHGLNIEIPTTFGIAPSTLKHRETLANA